MKILVLTLLLMANSTWANEELLETLFDKTNDTTITVEQDTYIPNIMGYACPVPAINLNRYSVWNRALNHRGNGDFGVKIFALRIKNPNMRFCEGATAKEVFGQEFKLAARIKLSIRTLREIFIVTKHNGENRKILRETITGQLNGKELFSQAQVDLGPL